MRVVFDKHGTYDQAWAYREPPNPGRTVLILGAGNASLLVPADFLTKIFAENKVAVLKMNEVNEYLGPLIEAIYRPLIDAGVLRVCYGGAEQGGYLVAHELVDEVHITGSHHTYEAIVFGPGKQGQERKREGKPLLEKPITGELGTVSPVIIVPGVWSPSDLRHAASHVAAMLTFNAGFNCLTSRVIITHVGWPQRNAFLQTLRQTLAEVPCRKAFYPGAEARHQAFLDVHPEAYRCGEPGPGQLPWTLVGGVDAEQQDDICFTTEAFCGLFAETALDAPTPTDFIDHAVAFANGTLWGSLTSTVIVRPADLRYPAVREAVDRAQANLRYGTVGINLWGGTSYMLMTSSWGAFPGHTHADIQSGVGVVNNWLLFRQVQKTVSRGPFHSAIQPASTPGNLKLMKNVARLEASHSWGDLVRTGVAATLFDPWHTLVRMVE